MTIHHNSPKHRFEAPADDSLSVLDYEIDGKIAVFNHTFVPPSMRGRGIAEELGPGGAAGLGSARKICGSNRAAATSAASSTPIPSSNRCAGERRSFRKALFVQDLQRQAGPAGPAASEVAADLRGGGERCRQPNFRRPEVGGHLGRAGPALPLPYLQTVPLPKSRLD